MSHKNRQIAGLSPLDRAKLSYPFDLADHEFLQGFVYIQEEAIAARLDKVDLDWTWKITDKMITEDAVNVFGTLTVNGVSKDGVGGQIVMRTSKKGALSVDAIAENIVNAIKGAATDAFKRAARLHGVGRSLLQAPKENNDFPTWLVEQHDAAWPELAELLKQESENKAQAIPAIAASPVIVTEAAQPQLPPPVVLAPVGDPAPTLSIVPREEPIPAGEEVVEGFDLPPLPTPSLELFMMQIAEFGVTNVETLRVICSRLNIEGYNEDDHYQILWAVREYADPDHAFETLLDGTYDLSVIFSRSPALQKHIDEMPKGGAGVNARRSAKKKA